MNRRSVVVLVASILVVGACGGTATSPGAVPASPSTSPSASLPTAEPSASARTLMLDARPMTNCYVSMLCGTLSVPEDRSKPNGRRIDLRVVVIPSSSRQPEADPLFALGGGPGSAASDQFTWIPNKFADILASRDVVLVDQRGTGGSNKLVIQPPPDWGDISQATRDARMAEWTATSLASMDADVRQYTTSVAMDDLDDVRAALGYDTINLYGPSYGGTAAQYYMRQYPEHVRTAILDGTTLVEVPIFERFAPSSQHALDLLLDRCERDGACHAAFPDARAEAAAVFARVAREPITLPNPAAGDPLSLDAETWARAVHSALVDPETAVYLPAANHLLATGNLTAFAELVAPLVGRGGGNDQDLAMSLVIRCSEAWARFDPSATRTAGAGSYLVEAEVADAKSQAARCASVPRGVVLANDGAPVRSNVPVLLILGDGDPQNPPANVAAAPRNMPNSVTVVVPGFGHTVGHSGCMPKLIGDFLDAGSVRGLDTSCAQQMVPPAFVIP